jgi:hypothetical protein
MTDFLVRDIDDKRWLEQREDKMLVGVWRSDVFTRVVSVEYNFPERKGRLIIEGSGICNAIGCIKFFQNIDSAVEQFTIDGGEFNSFTKQLNGKWRRMDAHSNLWEIDESENITKVEWKEIQDEYSHFCSRPNKRIA